MDILEKIKQAGLVGRGGACFPVAKKWEAVKNAVGVKKYVVCNAAEGEPGVLKDGFILEHYAEKVIDGMKIAIDFLGADKGYLFLSHAYGKKLNKKLSGLLKNSAIEIDPHPQVLLACLFHPWKREKSPAFHASRSPGALRSQSGRTSLIAARRSRQRSLIDGRPQNQ